jgi:hypothetical protein
MILGLLAVILAGVLPNPAVGSSADISAIEGRLFAMQDIEVTYRSTIKYNIDPELMKHDEGSQPNRFSPTRITSGRERFTFAGGAGRLERWTSPETTTYWKNMRLPYFSHQIQVLGADGRLDELSNEVRSDGKGTVFGGISQPKNYPEDWTVDIALGLRLYRGSSWLSADELQHAVSDTHSDGLVELTINTEAGVEHRFRFDANRQYALIYYRCTFSGKSFEEFEASDFKQFGVLSLPQHILRRTEYPDSHGNPRHPNGANKSASGIQIQWPAGLKIFDSRANAVVDVGPSTRQLSDDDIHAELQSLDRAQQSQEDEARMRIEKVLGTAATSGPATNP